MRKTGFDKMWRACRQLEMSYLKYCQHNMRRFGNIHENLQMFVDEAIWRAEHGTMQDKREALAKAFNVQLWAIEDKEVRNGIGGGYG